MDNFNLKKYLVENKRTANSPIPEEQLISENEVTYKEKKTISSVTFLPREEGGAKETFTLGKEIDGEDYWGTVTQITPIAEKKRHGDFEGVVVAIKTKDGNDGMKFHFNAYGEYVEV